MCIGLVDTCIAKTSEESEAIIESIWFCLPHQGVQSRRELILVHLVPILHEPLESFIARVCQVLSVDILWHLQKAAS